MTTLQTFNTLLRQFLDELATTFPEDAALAVSVPSFDKLVKANARKPLDLFNESLGPHAQLVMTKDPALFDQGLTIAGTIDLKTYWETPDLTDASRAAIWQYLQSLLALASTVSALPPEMLTAIESMAQECASKISSGETDLASMTSMLLGNGAGADGGGLASLFNSLGSSLGSSLGPSLGSALTSHQSSDSSTRRSKKKNTSLRQA